MGTKAEEAHKDGVAGMGCLRCLENGYEDTPAEIHHCGTYSGGGRDDMRVVGLCPTHHRWALGIPTLGKERREHEARWLEYVAEHCPCFTCKEARKCSASSSN